MRARLSLRNRYSSPGSDTCSLTVTRACDLTSHGLDILICIMETVTSLTEAGNKCAKKPNCFTLFRKHRLSALLTSPEALGRWALAAFFTPTSPALARTWPQRHSTSSDAPPMTCKRPSAVHPPRTQAECRILPSLPLPCPVPRLLRGYCLPPTHAVPSHQHLRGLLASSLQCEPSFPPTWDTCVLQVRGLPTTGPGAQSTPVPEFSTTDCPWSTATLMRNSRTEHIIHVLHPTRAELNSCDTDRRARNA